METSSVRTISDRENPIKAPGGDEVAEEEADDRRSVSSSDSEDSKRGEDNPILDSKYDVK